MSIADIFSTSFLLSVTVIVILIGGMFAYINFRVSEQDHKLNSMISLVSALAQEVTYNKNVMHSLMSTNTNTDTDNELLTKKIDLDNKPQDLIEVSDDDEEDDDEDDDDEDDDDEDDDDEDDDDEDDDEEDDDEEQDKNKEINIINLSDGNDIELNIDDYFEDINKMNDTESLDTNVVDNNTDTKQIQISQDDFINNNTDYKKLPLNKLREIVLEKGLVQDSSKLKKNEILKLLE
jgi:hypothetical protein